MDYKEVYLIRRKKVGKTKARFSSNAVKKSMYVKEFLKTTLKNRILENWGNNKEVIIVESVNDYKTYKVNNEYIVTDMNIKLLKENFDNIIKKGRVGDIKDEYSREILMKAVKEHKLTLNPSLYYVIFKG